MNTLAILRRFLTLGLLILAGQALTPLAAKDAGTTLSIDQLYQPQSVIGTSPEGFSWSRDGGRLLFLWNSEGYTFRDVWLYTPATGEKRQLTFLGKDVKPEAEQRGVSQA